MYWVYIIYSKKIHVFYIGYTSVSPFQRLLRHNEGYYDDKYTSAGKPWELFLQIECNSAREGLDIEKHIKKMKSKVYIQNLKKYPEMVEKLISKYRVTDS